MTDQQELPVIGSQASGNVETLLLSLGAVVDCTQAEGPGKRFAIWTQGCPLRCPGCCNPELLRFEGGTPTRVADLIQRLTQAHQQHQLEGITLIGGEPTAQPAGLSAVARSARQLGLSVMLFTGRLLEDLQAGTRDQQRLIELCDLVVDGPYQAEHPDNTRRWVGSTNQRIHFLTDYYHADDERWNEPNTLEIRLQEGEIFINGFPSRHTTGLWRRITKN